MVYYQFLSSELLHSLVFYQAPVLRHIMVIVMPDGWCGTNNQHQHPPLSHPALFGLTLEKNYLSMEWGSGSDTFFDTKLCFNLSSWLPGIFCVQILYLPGSHFHHLYKEDRPLRWLMCKISPSYGSWLQCTRQADFFFVCLFPRMLVGFSSQSQRIGHPVLRFSQSANQARFWVEPGFLVDLGMRLFG